MHAHSRGLLALAAAGLLLTSGFAATAGARRSGRFPVLAYYYIWYNPESWNRAKIDYPLLGRYSSDDTTRARSSTSGGRNTPGSTASSSAGSTRRRSTRACGSWSRSPTASTSSSRSSTRGSTSTAGRFPSLGSRAISSSSSRTSRAIPAFDLYSQAARDLVRHLGVHARSDPAGGRPGARPAPRACVGEERRRATTGSRAPSTATRTTGRRSTRRRTPNYATKLVDMANAVHHDDGPLDRAGRARLRRPARRGASSSSRAEAVRRCAPSSRRRSSRRPTRSG